MERWLDITRQRWKARTAYLFAAGIVGAFATLVLSDDRRMVAWAVAAFVGASVGCAAFMLSVRCLVCDEYVMFSLWKSSRDPIGRLDSLDACPNCGARTNDERLVP